jgi:hypothetical protein
VRGARGCARRSGSGHGGVERGGAARRRERGRWEGEERRLGGQDSSLRRGARANGDAPKISVQPARSPTSESHFQPDLDMHVVLAAPADATRSRASFMVERRR